MKVAKETILEMIYDSVIDGFTVVEDEPCNTWRWGTVHRVVFAHGEKHYTFGYRTQPEMGIKDVNYFSDEVECVEVRAREVTTIEWVAVKAVEPVAPLPPVTPAA